MSSQQHSGNVVLNTYTYTSARYSGSRLKPLGSRVCVEFSTRHDARRKVPYGIA